MPELLTAAQMRAIEQAAIASGDVTGLDLMERAGRGVVDAVFEEWPDMARGAYRAAILCGPGNNGGDGFVVARLLRDWGWTVEVFLYGAFDKLPPDARRNHDRWIERGEVLPYVEGGAGAFDRGPASEGDIALVVDALFGTGLTRPVDRFNAFGRVTRTARARASTGAAASAPRVVAIDMPSGVCADSGRRLVPAELPPDLEEIRADLTVSFHAEKLGHRLADGPRLCGKVVVKGIGLDGRGGASASRRGDVVRLVDRGCLDGLAKKGQAHKYGHGHALILSGGPGRTGAARLAARGALRIGAGLVTLGVPPAAQQEVACQITAVMLRRVVDSGALADLLDDPRFNALGLGPGLGLERARDLVPAVLAAKRATVLDADALTAFEAEPRALFDLLHDRCVLTPHGGEFKRLFPDIAERLDAAPVSGPAYSKVDATRAAAARAGCVVLFKGPDTVIAAPDGRCDVTSAAYERAAPWLATAGAGDVLTGFIAGLLARGFSPMAAPETAARCHVDCALSFGPGLIAEDLPDRLPAVLRAQDGA